MTSSVMLIQVMTRSIQWDLLKKKWADHMLAVYVRGVCIKETVSHICMFILNESIKPVHLFFSL